MLTFIGTQAGDNWEDWKDSLHYFDYAVAAIIVGLAIYYGTRWYRGRNGGDGDGDPSSPTELGDDPGEPAADVRA